MLATLLLAVGAAQGLQPLPALAAFDFGETNKAIVASKRFVLSSGSMPHLTGIVTFKTGGEFQAWLTFSEDGKLARYMFLGGSLNKGVGDCSWLTRKAYLEFGTPLRVEEPSFKGGTRVAFWQQRERSISYQLMEDDGREGKSCRFIAEQL